MPRILEHFPNVCLRIAGHDHRGHRTHLERLIDRLGLGAHVTLVGFQGDVAAFLAGIDVFALASRAEGFGQVLLEAMAAGRPIVASRIAPFDEIVVDGSTGLLADPDNPDDFAAAIIRLLSRQDEAARMGDAGRRRARDVFPVSAMVDRTLKVYQRVLATSGRARPDDGLRGSDSIQGIGERQQGRIRSEPCLLAGESQGRRFSSVATMIATRNEPSAG
jgi:glycosyltransferase involved in cell wall biosynthesis